MNGIYNGYAPDDFDAFVIITETDGFATPDATYCASIRDRYDLDDVTVLYDDGSFAALGFPKNHLHLVLERGMRIHHRAHYREDTFEAAIDELLGR